MRPLYSFLLLIISSSLWCVGAQNNIENRQLQTVAVERYLILHGCKDTKPSGLWQNIKARLEERISFNSITCIASEEDEQRAINFVLEQKLLHPDNVFHVVAALLTSNHCEEGAICRDVNPGDKYLPLLRAGVNHWFIETEPDFVDLGVNRTAEGLQSVELFPDNASGGRQVGYEFCRIAASIAPANIAVLYGSPTAAHSTARIENFISGMEESCPEARHQVKYSFYADWSADKAAAIMSPVFLRDSSIDAVIAANDDMALGALVSAREMRPDKQLLVAGYDASDFVTPLLASGAMFATVDQNPPSGLVYSLEIMLSDNANGAGEFGPPSECSMKRSADCTISDYNTIQSSAWEELGAKRPEKLSTAVSLRSKDPSALLLIERLVLYNPGSRPPLSSNRHAGSSTKSIDKALEANNKDIGQSLLRDDIPPVPVLALLRNYRIYEVNAEAQSTTGQGLLVLSWTDTRLAWSKADYPEVDSVNVQIDEIWHPVVVLGNLLRTGSAVPMRTIRTTVFPDGDVVWEQTINTGEFRCASIDETVFHFPFDEHRCGVDITSYSPGEFSLYPTVEIGDDEALDVTVSNTDWFQGETFVDMETSSEPRFETVHYKVEMTRDPLFIELSYIIPSYLLNVISFAQFWIPTQSDSINLDRGGMAITTILSSLALRDSTTSEVGTSFTLLDLFMMMSLLFHFVGFLITAYESSYMRVKKRNEKDDQKIGIADRLGKVGLPVVFGLFNLILSVFWAKGRI